MLSQSEWTTMIFSVRASVWCMLWLHLFGMSWNYVALICIFVVLPGYAIYDQFFVDRMRRKGSEVWLLSQIHPVVRERIVKIHPRRLREIVTNISD